MPKATSACIISSLWGACRTPPFQDFQNSVSALQISCGATGYCWFWTGEGDVKVELLNYCVSRRHIQTTLSRRQAGCWSI